MTSPWHRPLLCDVEQQRRLADAGLAGQQHHRAGHDAAAEHAVELGDAGRFGPGRLDADRRDRPGRLRAACGRSPIASADGSDGAAGGVDDRAPLAALRAPADPLRAAGGRRRRTRKQAGRRDRSSIGWPRCGWGCAGFHLRKVSDAYDVSGSTPAGRRRNWPRTRSGASSLVRGYSPPSLTSAASRDAAVSGGPIGTPARARSLMAALGSLRFSNDERQARAVARLEVLSQVRDLQILAGPPGTSSTI